MSSLSIRSEEVNEAKGSAYIKSGEIAKNINDTCSQHIFAFTQHYKEIKNYPGFASNIKRFIDLYVWKSIEYPTAINNNNYTLFEINNIEIGLIVLCVYADVKIFQNWGKICAHIHKSIKQSYVSKKYFEGEISGFSINSIQSKKNYLKQSL